MNSKLIVSAILMAVLACLVKETDGTKCYFCKYCNDPFDSTGVEIKECPWLCAKDKLNGQVARDCAIENVQEEICITGSRDGKTGADCACKGDLCNGGSVQRLSVMLSVSIFVVMILKTMFW